MPSFLVTKQMSPALAARVMASVTGRRAKTPGKRRRPLTAALRLAALVLMVATVGTVIHIRHRSARQLRETRESLLHAMRAEVSSLSAADRDTLRRVEAAISAHSAPGYAGDWIADDLQSESRLAEALQLPTIYVRGPQDRMAHPGSLAQIALDSRKDAFVLCLLDPPEARTEKALKAKARAATVRGKIMQVTANVEPLAPLFQALPLLNGDWERRAMVAEPIETLSRLRKMLEAAPVEAAVRAAKAHQLLVVMDEAGDAKGPTELDGERPHSMRVILADLSNDKVRLRFRHDVDPSWISPNTRAEYASGIDSCGVAMDLRSAVLGRETILASDRQPAKH